MSKNAKIILTFVIIIAMLIGGAVYLKANGNPLKKKPDLTREQMQAMLLTGNKYSGADIEAMSDAQLLAAVQAGGYKLIA